MTTADLPDKKNEPGRSFWVSALIPTVALGLLITFFAAGNPLAIFTQVFPPIEDLSFERIRVVAQGFEVQVINGGPEAVTIAQVLVDDAYWQFDIEPSPEIGRLANANISIPYPWVEGEPHDIRLITSTGATFDTAVEIAIPTPSPGGREFLAYGMVGVYVGIIPVALGLLWYPAMRRLDRKWLGLILALTVGLLVFLLIDTFVEALEFADALPSAFQGITIVIFSALLTWFLLIAVRSNMRTENKVSTQRGLSLATLIAFGIGLHNLGEGLAIGTAFALGEAALGSFLVVGFTLHNVTEGVGIAAPLLPRLRSDPATGEENASAGKIPKFSTFLGLALLAGAPAILGTWIGGFASSPLLTVLFLGIGVGAIWQVIAEVTGLLRTYAENEKTPLASWPNMIGFTLGFLIMYLTAFLVNV